MYAEAVMNTVTDTCNNSPRFTAQPIPYVCINQPVFYNFGAYDPDGDSIVYSLLPARSAPLTILPYNVGYSPGQPLPGLSLDPLTGAITFTPTVLGQFIVAVLVKEYDSNGDLLGTIMRDIQFAVITCPTNTPPIPANQVSNVSGNATLIGPTSFLICPGEFMSFDLEFTDVDAIDTLTLTSNVLNVLPGATFSQSGINPATASVTWTATNLGVAGGSSFVISALDNGCPISGINQQTIYIQLADTIRTGPDVLLCNGSSAQLSVVGGAAYQWSVLSGPPIIVGTNFSCDTCDTPLASPTATTTYMVESNVVGQCVNTDTITVTVSPPFSINSVNYSDVTCFGDGDGEILLSAAGPAGPPWEWGLSGGGLLIDSITSASNIAFSGLGPGTYAITLTEQNGCFLDTVVTIDEPTAVTITTGDTLICLSNNATVSAVAGGGNGNFSYDWNNGLVGNGPHVVSPSTTTYYTVLATDQLGCAAPPDSFLVSVNPPLLLNPSWSDSVCVGEPAILSGGGSGGDGGPYTYSWLQVGTGPIGTGNSVTITPTSQNTDVIVTMTDNCGTPSVSMTLPITWHEVPQPIVTPDITEGCVPAAFNFSNGTDPALIGGTCVWDLGDGTVITGACGNIQHSYQSVGCFTVNLTVYSSSGCPGDSTFADIVCVNPNPVADFTFGPQPADVYDPTIYFLNNSINGVSYLWNFGPNGSLGTTTSTDPVWLFPDDRQGTYPVTLFTTNIHGCVDTLIQYVNIDADYYVWVPNAFTPDGDGKNNVFAVVGDGISPDEFSMQIFNRWGELIFESKDLNIGWDGSNAIQGVYAYRIEARNRFTKLKKLYSGHVTLLR
jgi:gliding motility-associated-like protein